MDGQATDESARFCTDGLASRDRALYLSLLTAKRAVALEDADFAGAPVLSAHCADGATYRYVEVGPDVCVVSARTSSPVLEIPAFFEGKRVRAVSAHAFSYMRDIEQIVMPARSVDVGVQAFLGCLAVKRIVFSPFGHAFDRAWLRGCSHIREIVLPGRMESLSAADIDIATLRRLSIGAGLAHIADLAFSRFALERIDVSADNPFFSTDGRAVFSKDGSVLVAMATGDREYVVPSGVRVIARKAFAYDRELSFVRLPEGLEEIGAFAFFETGLQTFSAPESLKIIRAKAFYQCANLASADVGGALVRLGSEAFARSSLSSLSLPASLEAIGRDVVDQSHVVASGPECSFSIDAANPALVYDGEGGIYRRVPGGLEFLNYIGEDAEFSIAPGTVRIADRAFQRRASLRSVTIPEGVREVGEAAFFGCSALEEAVVPDSVENIAAEAFCATSLKRFSLPARCDHMGLFALSTGGGFRGGGAPTLCEVEIRPGNERFYLKAGMLCERINDRESSAVLYVGPERVVVVPREVVAIGPYAFAGATGVEELHLHGRIRSIETRGLALGRVPSLISLEIPDALGGSRSVVARYPDNARVLQIVQSSLRFSRPCAEAILEGADIAMQRFGSLAERSVSAVRRLSDPVHLTDVHRDRYAKLLSTRLIDVAKTFAKRNDTESFRALADLGYLSSDTITDVIDALSDDGDATMTGYLLEMKRRRFGGSRFDFDL